MSFTEILIVAGLSLAIGALAGFDLGRWIQWRLVNVVAIRPPKAARQPRQRRPREDEDDGGGFMELHLGESRLGSGSLGLMDGVLIAVLLVCILAGCAAFWGIQSYWYK